MLIMLWNIDINVITVLTFSFYYKYLVKKTVIYLCSWIKHLSITVMFHHTLHCTLQLASFCPNLKIFSQHWQYCTHLTFLPAAIGITAHLVVHCVVQITEHTPFNSTFFFFFHFFFFVVWTTHERLFMQFPLRNLFLANFGFITSWSLPFHPLQCKVLQSTM